MNVEKRDPDRMEAAKTMADLLAKVPQENRWVISLMVSAFIDGMTIQEELSHPASTETLEIARRLGLSTRRVQQFAQQAADARRAAGMENTKKPADNELQPHCQLGKNYESLLENGTAIHVHITMSVSGAEPESTEKILSEFARCSRSFYLDAGENLNSKP